MSAQTLPTADGRTGFEVLRRLARERSLLAALEVMRRFIGRSFRLTLPGFQPAFFSGPRANREILVSGREHLSWRTESDPVTRLLGQGLLVVDGERHDRLRAMMEPALVRAHVHSYIGEICRRTDEVTSGWRDGEVRDMLIEMRRLALLILFQTLYRVDFAPDLDRLWPSVLALLEYISPGPWILFPSMPVRGKYRRAAEALDEYLYRLIALRRAELAQDPTERRDDLLSQMVESGELSDSAIRDQLLTLLIAGHDTSTALLAWVFYLLGSHVEVMQRAQAEAEQVLACSPGAPTVEELNRLILLDDVIKETLRLYPPIHVGNRRASEELAVDDYQVPEGTRVMYSIYLSHRDSENWEAPDEFRPERFAKAELKRQPFAYLPFGGGPRNCIGAAFAQVEALAVLSRLLLQFDFALVNAQAIRPHMGATLEPRPGVLMRIRRKRPSDVRSL